MVTLRLTLHNHSFLHTCPPLPSHSLPLGPLSATFPFSLLPCPEEAPRSPAQPLQAILDWKGLWPLTFTQNCLHKLPWEVSHLSSRQDKCKGPARWGKLQWERWDPSSPWSHLPAPSPYPDTDTHTVKRVRVSLRWLISGDSRTQDFRDKT